jgi:uncharacterized protein
MDKTPKPSALIPSPEPAEVVVSFSVHEITVPLIVQGLMVMDDYLDHAQAFERANGLAPETVLGARLADDMLSFGEQFSVNCNKVEMHISQLLQRERPSPRSPKSSYPVLKGRLLATRKFLESLTPDELSGAQSHTYELHPPIVRGWFGGDDYIRHLVIPDFFFHIAMAHAILRHLGAPVGKRDYLGNLTGQSGGYA